MVTAGAEGWRPNCDVRDHYDRGQELCQPVHDRMPVIVGRENYERSLDILETDPADLLRPYDSAAMHAYPVSSRVNSPKNDDAELIAPLAVEWARVACARDRIALHERERSKASAATVYENLTGTVGDRPLVPTITH